MIGTWGRGRVVACSSAALLGIVVAVGLSAAPAAACSCGGLGDAEALELADVVFAGELLEYEPPPRAERMSSTDPATWTFGVSEVFKGEATEVQEVVSAVDGASCGLELPHEGTFLVFAYRDAGGLATGPNQLSANLCGGTRVGQPPAHFAELARAPKPLADVPIGDDAGDDGGTPWLPIAGVATAVAVVGAAAVAFVRRRPTA